MFSLSPLLPRHKPGTNSLVPRKRRATGRSKKAFEKEGDCFLCFRISNSLSLSFYLLLGRDGRARVRRRRRVLLVEVLEHQGARGEDGERAGGHGERRRKGRRQRKDKRERSMAATTRMKMKEKEKPVRSNKRKEKKRNLRSETRKSDRSLSFSTRRPREEQTRQGPWGRRT